MDIKDDALMLANALVVLAHNNDDHLTRDEVKSLILGETKLRDQHARIAELEAERDQYAIWLAGCRDAFPAPEVNTTADELLMMAIADPGDVLAYVKHRAAPAAQSVEHAAVVVPNEDLQDLVSKALLRAWQLGQTYWHQVDSEYTRHHKKADETQAKFSALIEETRAALSAIPAAQAGSNRYCGAGMCVATDKHHAPGCTAAPQAQDAQRDAERWRYFSGVGVFPRKVWNNGNTHWTYGGLKSLSSEGVADAAIAASAAQKG